MEGGDIISISFWIQPSEIHIDNWNPLSDRKWKHLLLPSLATEAVLFSQVYFNFSGTSIWRFIFIDILFRLCLPKSEVAGTFSISKKLERHHFHFIENPTLTKSRKTLEIESVYFMAVAPMNFLLIFQEKPLWTGDKIPFNFVSRTFLCC